jgi:hypothetical protein
MKTYGGLAVLIHSFLTSALVRGELSTPHLKGSTNSLYAMILLCILMTSHQPILSFVCVSFQTSILAIANYNFCIFLYGIYVISQQFLHTDHNSYSV